MAVRRGCPEARALAWISGSQAHEVGACLPTALTERSGSHWHQVGVRLTQRGGGPSRSGTARNGTHFPMTSGPTTHIPAGSGPEKRGIRRPSHEIERELRVHRSMAGEDG